MTGVLVWASKLIEVFFQIISKQRTKDLDNLKNEVTNVKLFALFILWLQMYLDKLNANVCSIESSNT